MKFYLISVIFISLISFILGVTIKSVLKIDGIIKTNIPIGFCILLSFLYPGYFLITDCFYSYANIHFLYITFTIITFIIVIIFGLLYKDKIKKSITDLKYEKSLIIIVAIIIAILGYLFINTEYNFRVDDINFYGKYIPSRIFLGKNDYYRYNYQSFYVLFSVLLQLSKSLFGYNLADLGYVINVIGLFGIILIALAFGEVINYTLKKINNKNGFIKYFILICAILIFLTDYWIFQYPHFSGTLRIVPSILIYIILENSIVKNERKDILLLSLLFGSLISLNSSGFFIGVLIIYCYLIYCICNKKKGYIYNSICFSAYFISYAWQELSNYRGYLLFFISILIFIILFKIDDHIEKIFNKFNFGYILMIVVPFVMIFVTYVLHVPSEEYFNTYVTSRDFFDNINYFDMVPDLFLHNTISTALFNFLFWMMIIFYIATNFRSNNFYYLLLLTTFITFYNPFTYRFVSTFLTNVAFYRLSFVFYNPIIIVNILIDICDKREKYQKVFAIYMLVITISKLLCTDKLLNYLNTSDDYSYLYHCSNKDLQVVEVLDEIHKSSYDNKIDEEIRNPFIHDGIVKLGSQIYGAQLLSTIEEEDVENVLRDRFSYQIIDTDEFEQVFSRRIPGYDLPDVDYTKACTLAYDKQLDYVILEAQYNWELQTGLWPCSYQVGEDIGTYRILKMDYEYWQYNIDMGYTEIYEVKDQK